MLESAAFVSMEAHSLLIIKIKHRSHFPRYKPQHKSGNQHAVTALVLVLASAVYITRESSRGIIMNKLEKKTSNTQANTDAKKEVGSSMARLLTSTEAKTVGGARSGPSPRGPGH